MGLPTASTSATRQGKRRKVERVAATLTGAQASEIGSASASSTPTADAAFTAQAINVADCAPYALAPVCRNVFIQTVLTAAPHQSGEGFVFGHADSHRLLRVRLAGVVREAPKEASEAADVSLTRDERAESSTFVLDDGTGVLNAVYTREIPPEGSTIELIGQVRGNRDVDVIALTLVKDPLHESKRWHDIVRLHTEFYDKPAPPPIASGPPPRRAPSTDPERQETDQPQKWTRFSLKKAIEVSESEAAEVAAACEAAFAASQPSQESQVVMAPLAERVEQIIRAADGVSREELLRRCEGVTAQAMDDAITQLLLAGHAYLDGNLYRLL